MSADIFEMPCAAMRASSAASIDDPIPEPRMCAAVARNTTQPCACAARPIAAPTTSSPTTATTAWSFAHDASTSDSP